MYKAMTASPKTQWFAPAALVGTGTLGYRTIQGQKMPQVQTAEGQMVPANVEFVEKQGALGFGRTLAPIGGGALLTLLMAQDYADNPWESPVSRMAWDYPIATLVAGTAASGGALDLGRKALKKLVKRGSANPADLQDINLDEVVKIAAHVTLS